MPKTSLDQLQLHSRRHRRACSGGGGGDRRLDEPSLKLRRFHGEDNIIIRPMQYHNLPTFAQIASKRQGGIVISGSGSTPATAACARAQASHS